ncbi:MAG TPA: carboxypeptidase-like regulatory domain-containing protein, partial [Terriglobia bacterium]|nr:carboxypeptidase-like regulatory domain-containing protein [Terriglobia bacterium]
MKTFRIAVLFGLFYMQLAAVQQPPGASLEGVVTKWRTGEPVPNVSVELRTPTGEKLPIPATLSANDGRFVFPFVPPGKYRLIGMRAGYVRSEFGQRSYGGPTQELALSNGQHVSGLRLVMTPGAVVSGRVTSAGQPSGAADVYAIKASTVDGTPAASLVLSAKTNDLGEFSLFWLPPGSYYIGALVMNTGMGARNVLLNADGDDRNSLHEQGGANRLTARPPQQGLRGTEAYVPMYFPATPDILAAQLIEVTPGIEIRNINIDSRSLPAYRVQGRISGGIPLGPAENPTRVRLNLPSVYFGEDGGSDLNTGGMRFAVADANGLFDIARVTAGSYFLSLSGGMVGSMPVEVRGDIANLVVTPVETVRPLANVILEGSTPADLTPPLVTLKSILTPSWERNSQLHRLVNMRDGSYQLVGSAAVPVGDYRVFVEPILTPRAPGNTFMPATTAFQKMYVKSIRLGDADVLRDGLRLQSQPANPLVIVLGKNPGALEGQVHNERKAPAPDIWV